MGVFTTFQFLGAFAGGVSAGWMLQSIGPQATMLYAALACMAWAWLWVGLWGAFVWGLGGEDLSMDGTSRFLGPLIQWLLPNISQVDNELVQFYLRKRAHFAEYAVLAVLILRALMAEQGK